MRCAISLHSGCERWRPSKPKSNSFDDATHFCRAKVVNAPRPQFSFVGGLLVKKLLVIAFHFPPIRQSSGVHRTLNFVRQLRAHDWESIVITALPSAYESAGGSWDAGVPDGMVVERTFALDAARHLSIAGRFPGFLANPDRWGTWRFSAVHRAMHLVRQYQPAAILSTFPIATAHLIAARVAGRTGLPWIADFRDSMVDETYPSDQRQRRINLQVERRTVGECSRAVFTTESTRSIYAQRYPGLPGEQWHVIPNGYDEAAFEGLATTLSNGVVVRNPLVLLHSGILYPVERDPMPFLRALKRLKDRGEIDATRLHVRLRATAHDTHYAPILAGFGLGDIVELAEPLPYRQALQEMLAVDGLLLFQSSGCNHQVPAKLYEYLRAQKPIIALTDPEGDTANILRNAGADNLLPLDDEQVLVRELPDVLTKLKKRDLRVAPIDHVAQYSRERGAAQLAQLLNDLVRC